MNQFNLYYLSCPITNEVRYVGITTQPIKNRLSQHLRKPSNYLMNKWIKSLTEVGLTPKIKVIKECDSYDELLLSEINKIKKIKNDGGNLLNILDGGDINPMFGKSHSDETKKIMSEKGKLRVGEKNNFYGKKHSETSKIKRRNTINANGGVCGENNSNYKYDIDIEELKVLYLNQNKTIIELSKIYNCHINTINKKLRDNNIFKPKSNKYNLDITEITQHLNDGLNYVQIGEKYGCCNKIIYKFIYKNNIHVK
jgi:hypothetical protein